MKKLIAILFLCGLSMNFIYGQAKKPTIMVVPSDNWCINNGYFMEIDRMGEKIKVPNYRKAFQESSEMGEVITQMSAMMGERGFPLKDLESALKTVEENAAENQIMTSKSGSGVTENPIDVLKNTAKADIIMQLGWTVQSTGPKKSINFNLKGLDAYTDKVVSAVTGTGAPSMNANMSVLLKEAVISHLDNFNSGLQTHFDDLFENGREVIVRVKVWDDSAFDLEAEFDDEELGDIIETWMHENTVKHRFSTTTLTESQALFEQVRIPLFNAKGRAMDTRRFVKGLSKHLKAEPYLIPNKVVTDGLGKATLIIGGK